MARRRQQRTAAPSQRQLRVGELVRHAVAELLMRGAVHDDVLTSRPVTIPEVRMSADLRLATVYVTAAGQDTDDVIAALNRAKKFIRGEVARAINLKFAPDVRFLVDETLDEATRIEQVLRSPHVAQDLKKS